MLNPKELRSKLKTLRSEYTGTHHNEVPLSIKFLEDLASTDKIDEKIELLNYLSMEYARYGMKDKQEEIIRQITILSPDNPVSWVGLAEYLINESKSLDEALLAAKKAVTIASEKGVLIRYAHNAQARVAKKICDYPLLEKTIEFLLSYKPMNNQDIGYENDFLLDLPDGAVNKDLIKKYNSICNP
jgi:hypothetical protein